MKNSLTYTDAHAAEAAALFAQLDRHWTGSETGMARAGYSREETEAFGIASEFARRQGRVVLEDAAGNRVLLARGMDADLPVNLGGSHMDAVPKGGRYDGPAGVAVRLMAMQVLHEAGFAPRRGFGAILFRNEESPWFGDYAVGSKLATARLPASFLTQTRKDSGRTLFAHMEELGMNPEALAVHLREGRAALPVDLIDSFHETHIEQGPLLARAGQDIGVVEGIRGNVRFLGEAKVVFKGVAGHTGAVPMGERVDAVAMGAEFVTAVRADVLAYGRAGRDAVVAFPIAGTGAQASPTTIPDHFEVSVEVRSIDSGVLADARAMITAHAASVAKAHGGQAHVDAARVVANAPAVMNTKLVAEMGEFAKSLGIKAMQMASGAGHDAAILAWAGVPSVMTFLAHGHNGASHRPDEIMGPDADSDPVGVQSSFAKAVMLDAMHIATRCGGAVRAGAPQASLFERTILERGGRILAL